MPAKKAINLLKPKPKKVLVFGLFSILLFAFVFLAAPSAQAQAEFDTPGLLGLLTSPAEFIVFLIGSAVTILLWPILVVITGISGWAMDWGLSMTGNFINSDVVLIGWKFLRDFANLVFIFLLLWVAISKILGLEKYGNDKMIVNIVIAALLVNFSKIITLAIVDFSQILTAFFMNQAFDTGDTKGFLGNYTGISNLVMGRLGMHNIFKFSSHGDISGALTSGLAATSSMTIAVIMNIIVTAGVAIFFILGSIMLMVRLVALTLLTILSPLAFLSFASPVYRSWWSKWWSQLFNYALFAPAFAFFLFLALTFATEAQKFMEQSPGNANYPDLNFVSSAFFTSGSVMLTYVIILSFLYAGLFMSKYLGIKYGAWAVKTGTNWGSNASKWIGRTVPEGIGAAGKGIIGKLGGKIPGVGGAFKMYGNAMERVTKISEIVKLPGAATSRLGKIARRIPGTGSVAAGVGWLRDQTPWKDSLTLDNFEQWTNKPAKKYKTNNLNKLAEKFKDLDPIQLETHIVNYSTDPEKAAAAAKAFVAAGHLRDVNAVSPFPSITGTVLTYSSPTLSTGPFIQKGEAHKYLNDLIKAYSG